MLQISTSISTSTSISISINISIGISISTSISISWQVGPCHHGMASPQVADGGTASNMEGNCEYIE